MNVKSIIWKSLHTALTSGFIASAGAQQSLVLQNGLLVNGQAYQGCKDAFIEDDEATKNYGKDTTLYLAN